MTKQHVGLNSSLISEKTQHIHAIFINKGFYRPKSYTAQPYLETVMFCLVIFACFEVAQFPNVATNVISVKLVVCHVMIM